MESSVRLGLENLIASPPPYMKGKKLGLLCNPASVDELFTHASILIDRHFPGQLTTLFSPQHGFYAEKQDNMIESDHFIEPTLNLPVYSLYGETRIPTPKMFENIDILLVDIQDVGTRVYTFIYTVSHCMETAAALGKQVIILDRPNPIGGLQVEGNLLEPEYGSFVGRYPVPMRHGLTIGEICRFFNEHFNIGCDLVIIPMTGWKRSMYWDQTLRTWIPPSPNLPTQLSCMVYPGQVVFEGTNISEGRGTTLPFEQFGAPFIHPQIIKEAADPYITGAFLRIAGFEPTSGKWCAKPCRGFHLHVTDKNSFQPYFTSLLLMQLILRYHGDEFKFKEPPYEYEFEKLPMDLILGSKTLREQITEQTDIMDISRSWQKETQLFKSISGKFYQYE
ncbi:MAG: DUF1343 domain-containing protein [Proteobacteria bacterium]|nr:DUF1343 domain-containing protein [Pseudomonadota bacterium]MBU1389171.1 DUF1343 domain-containing protein [Pseudomonadota bacterium]MBU1543395.1 DUF1343 domain-containing protein [Pseudomonadota bacterium]MBU2430205.1 DUF1343 domain-containing protein [Pseudomonadota bacterium]MBU2482910.1 DUF1343 domain-containing protein [Pseudomonadota bacterium]